MTGRILRIITRLNVGGPATHVVLADRGLRERGWETLLVHGRVESHEQEVPLEGLGIPMLRLPVLGRAVRAGDDARALRSLVRIVRRYRPDIVHTHLSKAGLVGRTAAMLVSPAARIHTFHGTVFGGYFPPSMTSAIVRAERFLAHRSARIIALSPRQQAELVAHRIAPVDRIRIVPLGLDLARFAGLDRHAARAALGIPLGATVVVSIGRLVPVKRLDRLITAFAAVRHGIDARLYLVGDGSEREALDRQIDALGLASRVTLAGWRTDTPLWYAAADVVALTSDHEGTPLALIEAAAAARPVVATDAGGVADVVDDGVTGYVVPREDFAALVDRLERLVRDPNVRDRMAHGAPARASRYDAHRLVADLDELYREVLLEQRSGR